MFRVPIGAAPNGTANGTSVAWVRIVASPPAHGTVQPRIVALGGGTSLPAVLRGLARCHSGLLRRVTALVAVTDNGGSSGTLRRQLHMLAPGEIRNCLVALAGDDSDVSRALQYRFDGTTIAHLTGELPSREVLEEQTVSSPSGKGIRRIRFDRPMRPVPEAIRALVNADVIVVGPGSLYTSLLPVLLVPGVAATISGLTAVRIYVANLMTEPGETNGYTLEDHLEAIYQHTQVPLFDYVLVNTAPIPAISIVSGAGHCGETVVRATQSRTCCGAVVVERHLLSATPDGRVCHSPEALARAILELAELSRRTDDHCSSETSSTNPVNAGTAA